MLIRYILAFLDKFKELSLRSCIIATTILTMQDFTNSWYCSLRLRSLCVMKLNISLYNNPSYQ